MDEKIPNDTMEFVDEADLETVTGGVIRARKHIKIVNCRHSVNVRSSASSKDNSNIIGSAFLGDRYVFYGWAGINWARIQYGSTVAYVFKNYVQIV